MDDGRRDDRTDRAPWAPQRRLAVLHLMASGERGGGLQHLLGLLPELEAAEVGCRIGIGAAGPGAEALRAVGLQVDTLDLMGSRFDPGAPGRVARLVNRHAPDLVHVHGTRAAFFAVLGRLGRRPFGPPHVYTAHGLGYRKTRGRAAGLAAEAVICRNVERVIAVSQRDLDDLVRRRLLSPERGRHVGNAVDTRRFAPGDAAGARRLAGVPEDALVVGTVARLVPQKAVGDLVAAVLGLPASPAGAAAPRPAHLVVIGEGPQRAQLEAQAAPLSERAHFIGARDDVAQLLPGFDVFALSSRWEGEPVALLEAMACGLPCVATATSGSRELLEGTGAGVLVEPGQPAALRRALAELCGDAAVRRRLGEAARQAVASRTFAAAATSVRAVYAELVGRGVL